VLCCVRRHATGSANLLTSDFNFGLFVNVYSLSQAIANGSKLIKQQGPQQKSDESDHVWCSRPSRCCACAAVLTHEFMYNNSCLPHSWYPHVPQTHRFPSLIYCDRSVLADAWLFTDFIRSCNVINSVVPFSLSKFFCRCYKSGDTTTIITNFTCLIRSLAVTSFDWCMALSVNSVLHLNLWLHSPPRPVPERLKKLIFLVLPDLVLSGFFGVASFVAKCLALFPWFF